MRRLLSSLALFAILALGLLWLAFSQSGAQTGGALISRISGGRLVIEEVTGRLSGPLQIGELRWQTPELQITVTRLNIDWSPSELLQDRLHLSELSAASVHIDSTPSDTPTTIPQDLTLPVAVDLEKIAISSLRYGALPEIRQITGRLQSDSNQHQLDDFRASSGDTALTGKLALNGRAPFALSGSAALTGQLEQHPLALQLTADGELATIRLQATAQSGLHGKAEVLITPFAPEVLSRASFALDELDPAAWLAGAPTARFSLRGELVPEAAEAGGVSGHFTADNSLPGALDQQRLPLESLRARFLWRGKALSFSQLQATLPGHGKLAGKAAWENEQLTLALEASRLDASKIVSMLRSTQLSGPISASVGSSRQELKLQLGDTRFKLMAEASHADRQIKLSQLLLSSGPANLRAQGKLSLDQTMAFSGEGELQGFDPSRFAQLPAARINARFSADGRLAPSTTVNASFDLGDSQLAGQPLSGKGSMSIAWPRIPNVALQLAAGPNRLTASGAFGSPGDKLQLTIDAPKLDPYGLEGSLNAQFELSGKPDNGMLSGHLETPALARRGVGRIRGLSLKTELASAAGSPLLLDVKLEAFDSAEQRDLLRNLKLHAEGSRQAHQLTASSQLAGDQIKLAVSGNLIDDSKRLAWTGKLTELTLSSEEKLRNFRLTQPAPLAASREAWQIGPLQLASNSTDNNWQTRLQASADQKRLNATLNGQGARLGLIDGKLEATLSNAWQLNRDAPWLGTLQTDTADLGWLGEILGEQIHSAGRLKGRLNLAGSPARPLVSGEFKGQALSLRLADQGLHLANGELDVAITDNVLRVTRLGFDSLLQRMPRALQKIDDEALQQLDKRPGRLEITGEMRVDRNSSQDNAFLDIRLDRLGFYQLPDQWIAVSGNGRLALHEAALSIRGKLAVDAGYWQLARMGTPRLSDDVVVKSTLAEASDNKPRPRLSLDLSADFGKHFLFRGAGLSTRLSGDVRLRAEGRDLPRASGNIRMRDGRFEAYGQQLNIERGILSFQGLLDNPALDVRAIRSGLSVEAGVQISGNAQKPVIKLISDPDLPDAEKLAWLVLGHGPEQLGAGDASILLSAAGGLLGNDSGGVIQQLKSSFGIDEFGVRTGQLGDAGSRQRSSRVAGGSADTTASTGNQILSVGKRLSSNAVLSYEQALGKAESVVKLTVKLNRQLSLIGRAGSDNALDMFYTLTFGR